MSERRRALGRGLGALIPSGPTGTGSQRPVDVFFQDRERTGTPGDPGSGASAPSGSVSSPTADSPPEAVDEVVIRSAPSPADDVETDRTPQSSASTSASEALLAELEGATNDNGEPSATTAIQPAPPSPTTPDTSQAPRSSKADPRETGSAEDVVIPSPAEPDGDLRPVPGATFAEISVAAVHPNAKQPRQVFDDDELNELASSIREVGVLQPIVVRPSGTDSDGEATYELIMGERRWRASRIAGNTTVPAIIRSTSEQDMLRDALLENLHRAQLNPLEEAAAYAQLLEDFGCTHDELAVRIARSRPQISNTLRLLKLPPLVQRRVAAGVLSAGHARALLGLTDGAAMERLAQRIVAEGLSVRATEEIVTLGDDPMQPELRRRPRAGAHSAALNDLAARLSDNLDTKVKVNLGQRKGHVTIEFASVQDLNRILGVLVPKDPGVLRDRADMTENDGDGDSAVDVGE
ncbi:ParB/RepB/Spo0J family partition protein [Ruania albidiflava]|uniref:ParB/RepB/Spo0J family partition protein n=1 Tax=Ruania albidiflava TaxID=366586 RepID=UPI0023F3C957|nr:ParB/RepB/Spo0J family partition protein [Ruania albidiflava]